MRIKHKSYFQHLLSDYTYNYAVSDSEWEKSKLYIHTKHAYTRKKFHDKQSTSSDSVGLYYTIVKNAEEKNDTY